VSHFVLRTADGPRIRIDVGVLDGDTLAPQEGRLSVSFGARREEKAVEFGLYANGLYPILLPEPEAAAELHLRFLTRSGQTLEARTMVAPARKWTFYLTPHTHYDAGFTAPEPVVAANLNRDLDAVLQYLDETKDWPEESRFRWTVEGTALVENYLKARGPDQVERLMAAARTRRLEIAGFCLNLASELASPEELARCLLPAEGLRHGHEVPIDTAMIDDVPGYAWTLADLLVDAGIRRASFVANPTRSRFVWDRPGAVPRPFYWEGPRGHRLFVWYSDSYGEGNLFRERGLTATDFFAFMERELQRVMARNESAGYPHDEVQLRTGGDNLAPELEVSRNVRRWNDRYVWPRVRLATNREFLEMLETHHGARTAVYRGDIPSWWADGAASSAAETGLNRLQHPRLLAAHALWTLLRIADPRLDYPRAKIDAAYRQMIHFDEHTWGSSQSVYYPLSEETRGQWLHKAAFAHEAESLVSSLSRDALEALARKMPSATPHSLAVWNALGSVRTDIVELPLAGSGLEKHGLEVIDSRSGRAVPSQPSENGQTLTFVASGVPPLGTARFAVRIVDGRLPPGSSGPEARLTNEFYRVEIEPSSGGIKSWWDKTLGRELFDASAAFLGLHVVQEKPRGGRVDLDDRERRIGFDRWVPSAGRIVRTSRGPVYDEILVESQLNPPASLALYGCAAAGPCPTVGTRLRLYHGRRYLDATITLRLPEEHVDPEAFYVAFPFLLPRPQFRLEMANAVMKPGTDQLAYSCPAYFAIQRWLDVAGDGYGVRLVPLEAPLVMLGGLHAGAWADRVDLETGHAFSWLANNYWFTNFRAGQSGEITFRFRMSSYSGAHDSAAASELSSQAFVPLQAVWLGSTSGSGTDEGLPQVVVEPGSVELQSLKMAEAPTDEDAMIVQLHELAGVPTECRLRLSLPKSRRLVRVERIDVVERAGSPLPNLGTSIALRLQPNEVASLRIFFTPRAEEGPPSGH
jgi:hypothetical protein